MWKEYEKQEIIELEKEFGKYKMIPKNNSKFIHKSESELEYELIYKSENKKSANDEFREIIAHEYLLIADEMDNREYYNLAIKYYLKAIELGNSIAMYNLGLYYDIIEKNYPQAVKYYKMAIEKGDTEAMFNLALYYKNVEKNYTLMKKYYKMAIEKGDSDSMYNLGLYYQNIEKNDLKMKKYYKMAANKGDKQAKIILKCFIPILNKK